MPDIEAWGNFYVIVGSAAGALIGLQFVVMTLIAAKPGLGAPAGVAAFGTPTIIHFTVVLLLSAVLSIPWRSYGVVIPIWGIVGLGGIVYSAVVARRLKVQATYRPEFDDWLFYFLLPFFAYAVLAMSACIAQDHEWSALLAVGTATLLLLFVGIHNSWDSVTYHVGNVRTSVTGDREDSP